MSKPLQRNYGPLEQPQEDALHASRLLQVEERPFQRVTRALLSKDSGLRTLPKQLPSPPPEGEDAPNSTVDTASRSRQKVEDEIVLDLAALDNSIIRIQLIQSSNARERERYAAEKAKILDTAQAVRENIVALRMQLETAQTIMAQRKGYDELAAKILDDKKIKSREESRLETEKLEKEIDDLQQESAEYDNVWAMRKEQFEHVVAQGQTLLRSIKGIKDEPEDDKKDPDGGDEENDGDDGDDNKEDGSQTNTPLPGDRTPMPVDNENLATDDGGNATDSRTSPMKPKNRFLDVGDSAPINSAGNSPQPSNNDVDMADDEFDQPEGQHEIMDES